jgi:hypothetical protein
MTRLVDLGDTDREYLANKLKHVENPFAAQIGQKIRHKFDLATGEEDWLMTFLTHDVSMAAQNARRELKQKRRQRRCNVDEVGRCGWI